MPCLCNRGAGAGILVCRGPQRGSNAHGKDLAVGVLPAVWFTGHLVLFGEPWVEDSAKLHVAGVAPGRDDNALPCPDVHFSVIDSSGDSENSSAGRRLPDNRRQLVLQKDLDAFCSRAPF